MKKAGIILAVAVVLIGAAFAWKIFFPVKKMSAEEFKHQFISEANKGLTNPDSEIRRLVKECYPQASISDLRVSSMEVTSSDPADVGKNGRNISSMDVRITAKFRTADKKGLLVLQQEFLRDSSDNKMKLVGLINLGSKLWNIKSSKPDKGPLPNITDKAIQEVSKFLIITGVEILIKTQGA